MILVHSPDPFVRAAVLRAARPDEDVFFDRATCAGAVEHGFPRLLVWGPGERPALGARAGRLPSVPLTRDLLDRWEAERRRHTVPPPRIHHVGRELKLVFAARGGEEPGWVDRAFRDLSVAAGARLPGPFRGFARRVLEFPERYVDLHAVADLADLSRGALKARFRRRDLASPYAYLRWLRVLAVAHVLSDRSVTTLAAAHRLGFTHSGNMCRMLGSVSGLTPTEVRSPHGWERLVVAFSSILLDASALEAWETLDDLFLRRVA